MNISGYSFDGKDEKVLNKYREIINDSAPDDWYILASCAESCIKKDIINKEVAGWIDRSIKIRKTAYNMEIKGDYYIINKLPAKAGSCYLEAIKIGLEEDSNFDVAELQSKIAKIVNLTS
jgi:hypothetical protein